MGVKASQSKINGLSSIEDDLMLAPKGTGPAQGRAIHQLFSKMSLFKTYRKRQSKK